MTDLMNSDPLTLIILAACSVTLWIAVSVADGLNR